LEKKIIVQRKFIKKIFSLLNIEVKKKDNYLNYTFFSKKKIKLDIVKDIFKFHKKVDQLYITKNYPKEILMNETWKFWLENYKKKQMDLIKQNKVIEFKNILDIVFSNDFNFNKKQIHSKKGKYISSSHFNNIFHVFESVTNRKIEDLVDNNSWSKYGYLTKKGVVSSRDLLTGLQAHNIVLLINYINHEKKKKNVTFLDLGCGTGATVEKVLYFTNDKEVSMNLILMDFPNRLSLAYAYLKKIFPKKRIFLVSQENQVRSTSKIKGEKILLIPTIFYHQILKNYQINILNNQASFSEMGYKSVRFYLNKFVNKNLDYLIETNFNNKLYSNNLLGVSKHVFSRNFPIPNTHKLLISFAKVGGEKYVTNIYKRI